MDYLSGVNTTPDNRELVKNCFIGLLTIVSVVTLNDNALVFSFVWLCWIIGSADAVETVHFLKR
ncbi:hypothetical protein QNI22_01350 [Cytophagaceae bacterium BD1B2-1]|uniref:Uncharacterized protein n=1 Tax=Xanthocytophaga agilis TaxID=3048010 RepID=A0AAE3R247_9BACT|nr:hypothetical protein [Xanthocytophaga agilis]